MVPTAVLSAVLVLRRSQLGYALAAVYGVTFTMTTAAISGMLLSAWAVEGTLEIVPVAIFGLASLAALGLLVRIYRTPRVAAREGVHGRSAGPAVAG